MLVVLSSFIKGVPTKSPAEYYAFVEEKAIIDGVDKLTPYLNLNRADENVAYKTSVDVSYDRDTVDSLLQSTLGMGLSDLESSIGISLDSIGINSTVASKDGTIYESLGLNLNKVDIITLDLVMDTIKQEMLMRLPELSPAYFKQSLASGELNTGKYLEQIKKLTPDRTADFLKRYGKILSSSMKDVELTKNEKLSVINYLKPATN
jgi:hypothetical protein